MKNDCDLWSDDDDPLSADEFYEYMVAFPYLRESFLNDPRMLLLTDQQRAEISRIPTRKEVGYDLVRFEPYRTPETPKTLQ